MALRIPESYWKEILAKVGELNQEMQTWTSVTGSHSKYTSWSSAMNNFLNMVEGGSWDPQQTAARFEDFVDYTYKVMGTDYKSRLSFVLRSGLQAMTRKLAGYVEKVEAGVEKAKETALVAAEKLPAIVSKTGLAFLKPMLPYILILGVAGIGAYAYFGGLAKRPRKE